MQPSRRSRAARAAAPAAPALDDALMAAAEVAPVPADAEATSEKGPLHALQLPTTPAMFAQAQHLIDAAASDAPTLLHLSRAWLAAEEHMSMRCALLQLWALLRWFVLTRGLTGGDAALTTLLKKDLKQEGAAQQSSAAERPSGVQEEAGWCSNEAHTRCLRPALFGSRSFLSS